MSLIKGALYPDAKMIHDSIYDEKFQLFGIIEKNVTVTVPKAGLKICYICVTDLWGDGSNGTATISSGGLHTGGVAIHMKSQFSRGFAFRVQVYANRARR